MTSSGKVRKAELRELALTRLGNPSAGNGGAPGRPRAGGA